MNLLLLCLTALILGFRHGLDFDHIAAMLDMAGTSATDEKGQTAKKKVGLSDIIRNLKLPALYILGHACMIMILGISALFFGEFIPPWVDSVMERIVGATLLILSLYLFRSLYLFATKGEDLKLRSRWMLLFDSIARGWTWLKVKLFGCHSHQHHHKDINWDAKGSFWIGMIHGFGAETGTQVLLFASVIGVGSMASGIAMLSAFTLGMAMSTFLIAAVISAGLSSSAFFKPVMVVLGVVAAFFSLVVGLYFTFGISFQLPSF